MASTDPKPASGLPRDFMPRLVSGLALAAIAMALTWLSVWTFALLVITVALIVAWEWGRIVRKAEVDTILVVHLAAVLLAGGLSLAGLPALGVITVVVGAILAAVLGFEKLGRISALGVLYAGLPSVALIWIRQATPLGIEAALFLLLCVWASDTGAYFAGRTIGGPKLLPSISPNKTWSGAIGGIVASIAVALAFAAVVPGVSSLGLLALAVLLAVVSQAGDLMESALKRWHDVKDASGLIPGHGGFMDRVDGLIFAAVGAAILAAIVNIQAPRQSAHDLGQLSAQLCADTNTRCSDLRR